MHPVGPGSRFDVLFDDGPAEGLDLPQPLRDIYGPFLLPKPIGRPWMGINFVSSHDGRVSYAEAGRASGGYVSGFNRHDAWLMGLLRARADAIVVGDMTLRVEPEHEWTSDYICPSEAATFAELRQSEGRLACPLVVFLSLTGDLNASAKTIVEGTSPIVVATTTIGAAEASRRLCRRPNAQVVAFGVDRVDTRELLGWLGKERGAQHVLCEGGPRVYGSVLRDGALDDEFLTLAPYVIGGTSTTGARRPSLVEGVTFVPETAPYLALVSIRRAGDLLFLRSRVRYATS